MALGPKLTFIKAGDALVADTVMQNFQSIVDFLRAIPASNLLQYKYSWNATTNVGAVAVASTRYGGYQKVNIGGSPDAIELTTSIDSNIAGVFGAGDSVTVKWQKCTPSSASGPVAADAWTDLVGTATFDSTNTGAAFVVPDALAVTRYCQSSAVGAPPALSDGDWVRCKVVCAGAASIDDSFAQLTVKGPLRS
jgi:hypothetical protein